MPQICGFAVPVFLGAGWVDETFSQNGMWIQGFFRNDGQAAANSKAQTII